MPKTNQHKVPTTWSLEVVTFFGPNPFNFITQNPRFGQNQSEEIALEAQQVEFRLGHHSPKWEVSAGFRYAERSVIDGLQPVVIPMPEPSDPDFVERLETYAHVEIPISLRYFMSRKRLSLYLETGVAPGWVFWGERTTFYWYEIGEWYHRSRHTDEILTSQLQFTSEVGVGAIWQLSKRIGLTAKSNFEWQWFPLADQRPINQSIFAPKLGFGLRYTFFRKSRNFLAQN